MSWFSKDDDTPNAVLLALAVGELKGQMAALRKEVARLKAPAPVGEQVKDISPLVRAVIEEMSQGHGELLRHLEKQARVMFAAKMTEDDIIAAIKRGS
jgi:uncharacterized small protein (DUF1192 family)